MLYCKSCGSPSKEEDFYCENCRNAHIKFPEDFELYLSHEYLDIYSESNGSFVCRGVKEDVECPNTIVIPGIVDFIAEDFYSRVPFGNHEIIIEHGVIVIGDRAFEWGSLKSIKIPDSVLVIGRYAFRGNHFSNTLIEIPGSVEDIGVSSFEDSGISKLKLNEGILNIGESAFKGCNFLNETIEIPGSVQKIMMSSFEDSAISKLILNEGISDIWDRAFKSNNLFELRLPSSIIYIGEEAFASNCLSEVEIPKNIVILDPDAFDEDVELIDLNESQNIIDSSSIPYSSANYVFLSNGNMVEDDDDEEEDNEEDYGDDDEYNDSGLSASILEAAKNIFGIVDNQTKKRVDEIIDGKLNKFESIDKMIDEKRIENMQLEEIEDQSNIIEHDYLFLIRENGSIICKGFKNSIDNKPDSIRIPDNVEIIEFGAFTEKSISELKLGKDVTEIRDYAFQGHSLTSLVIPYNVKTIGNHAFSAGNDSTLSELIILAKNIHFGEYSFAGNCIEVLEIPSGNVIFSDGAFTGNELSVLKIPDNVTSIASAVFGMNRIHTVILGNGLKNIGLGAFMLNPIKQVYVPSSIIPILHNVFESTASINIID